MASGGDTVLSKGFSRRWPTARVLELLLLHDKLPMPRLFVLFVMPAAQHLGAFSGAWPAIFYIPDFLEMPRNAVLQTVRDSAVFRTPGLWAVSL